MAYDALILLPADSDVSIEEVRQILENYYSDGETDITFDENENELTVTIDDWNCFISLESGPDVIEESRELAKMFAKDRPDRDEIAASGIRLSISTDDDEDMDYFNDFLEILQELGDLRGARVWEGASQEFIN